MRAIKFRAWVKSIGGRSQGWHMVYLIYDNTLDDLQESDNWKPMQFTGLLDKNGKEIWEGDLLNNEPFAAEHIEEVKWRNGGFYLEIVSELCKGQCAQLPDNHQRITSEMTVIGNRYENPELANNETEDAK